MKESTPTYNLQQVIIDAGLAVSKSQVKRMAVQGQIALNGLPINISELALDYPYSDGDVITVGKHTDIKAGDNGKWYKE